MNNDLNAMQTDIPVVSAMMPAFNAERSIAAAIQSLLDQSFQNWELICFDDGSTDRTVEIVETFARRDTRVRLIRGRHGGRGRARNAILPHCRGRYVAMCDADDISFPERFRIQVDHLERNPEIAAVGAFQVPFSDRIPTDSALAISWPTTSSAIAQRFNGLRMGMPNSVTMVRRSCFDRVGGFDEMLLRAQDFGFYLKLHNAGARFENIAQALLYYRQEGRVPTFRYWRESEYFHALAIERAGVIAQPVSLLGRARNLLRRRLLVPRYFYFAIRRRISMRLAAHG